ncbi:MAG: tetratricopeptide repeat protein, partial [Methanothrix sp.]|nr:tetratricopeptide repeat protein [Methanothrix sp.]
MEKYNESVDAYDRAIKNIGSYRQDIHANQTEFLSYIWTSKSISLWQLMRYNESLAAVDKAVQIDPAGNYDAWAFKGELLASLGRYNESLKAFDGAAATVAASSQPEIRSLPWAAEGYVLMQMGRYEEADGIHQKIIGLNITGESANRRLADAWRGRGNALAKLGEYNESLQAFDKSIELYEYNAPYAWTGKGDALRSSGRYDEAVKAFDRALELYPMHADAGIARAQKGRGDSLNRLGKHDEALEAYGAAVEASDEAISAFNNATPLDRAVSFTFDLYPLDQKFWIDRGSALKALGREDEAKDAYENALDLANKSLLQSPQDFYAHDAKSKILFELSRYDESIQVYDQFIKTDPGPEASATALVWKSKLLFEMGRANESLDSLNQAVEVDPQSAEAWRWKAGIAAELGMYKEALAAYNETLQLGGQTENAEIWREKSGILKALGRQGEADAAFAKAKELGYPK